ncbi:hypothetical protein N474_05480 [Pseudoalteromonas luteoviolacea CPMOR-2]|uniref:Haemolysin-type calcium binding-related domain-containing protein n=1 Tax=Pseudoalteromonas luteoviolacea DSM 6061 TaxID=1365250 RepID=A0A167AB96_9GAMM|nr:calcium-binding protein [Pseudoalteromonas luteoviolacea]KZN45185.1 hypothetical protein N475_08025 [Pseudoalteromonas luteoviolacea DSM 6061]KZN60505.1 hypothetical protein N474_05480 [Pseudoalteromonas luteoviolacea CPMOR-2]
MQGLTAAQVLHRKFANEVIKVLNGTTTLHQAIITIDNDIKKYNDGKSGVADIASPLGTLASIGGMLKKLSSVHPHLASIAGVTDLIGVINNKKPNQPITDAEFYKLAAGTVSIIGTVAAVANPISMFAISTGIIATVLGLASLTEQISDTDSTDITKPLSDVLNAISDTFPSAEEFEKNVLGSLLGLSDFLTNLDQLPDLASGAFKDWLDDVSNALRPRRDPIVFDLDGDGIETVSANLGIMFDHNADGVRVGTGWVSADDGLLVLDLNNDGIINDGRELFGDNTIIDNGRRSIAKHGYYALKQHDENRDGVIDANDSIYGQLQIWQDLNQDGISQSNELKSLTDWGISSINLDFKESGSLQNGNQIAFSGAFTWHSGDSGITSALFFEEESYYQEIIDPTPISERASLLPEFKGTGATGSLRQAATRDENVARVLEQFTTSSTRSGQKALINKVIWEWSKSSPVERYFGEYLGHATLAKPNEFTFVSVNSENGFYRMGVSGLNGSVTHMFDFVSDNESDTYQGHAYILESFYGRQFAGLYEETKTEIVRGDKRFSTWKKELVMSDASQNAILNTYKHLERQVYLSLALQTRLRPLFNRIIPSFGSNGIGIDFSLFKLGLDEHIANTGVDGVKDLIDIALYLPQLKDNWTDLGDYLQLYLRQALADDAQAHALYEEYNITALEYAKEFDGTDQSDIVLGSIYKDTLKGYDGNDVLYAEQGNDTLYGGGGSDYLDGGLGNDTLIGESGNDVLDGGAGNDQLQGRSGNDNYLWGAGSGEDIILDSQGDLDNVVFKAGIESTDLIWSRTATDLKVTLRTTGETLTIKYFFYSEQNKIENFKLHDGTLISYTAIESQLKVSSGTHSNDVITTYDLDDTIYGHGGNDQINANGGHDVLFGQAGNDQLYAGNGNDTLDGGAGSDRLYGGAGNDIYHWGKGSGDDIIYDFSTIDSRDTSHTDKLIFGQGITGDDLHWFRENTDLKVTLLSTGETLILSGYFVSDAHKVNHFELYDGTVLDSAQIEQSAHVQSGSMLDEQIEGYEQNDILKGLGGNDILRGNAGDDLLNGGAGNDHLYGGHGNDQLEGGSGDDTLNGGSGSDIYFWGEGSGNDKIINYDRYSPHSAGDIDKLVFKPGVTTDDLTWSRSGQNLLATLKSTGETLLISNYFSHDQNKLTAIELADGTAITTDSIHQEVLLITGSYREEVLVGYEQDDTLLGYGGNDVLNAGSGNDVLDGGVGNDLLYGEAGNDLLDGGAGDDQLYGGAGSDTYYWGVGSGNDRIINYDRYSHSNDIDKLVFKAGITLGDLRWSRNEAHLEVTLVSTGETLRVDQFFSGNTGKLGSAELSDGTVIDLNVIEEQVKNLIGNAGDNTLTGYEQNESLSGLGGNDILHAQSGDDLLDGGSGDDYLYGGDGNDILDGDDGNDVLDGGKGNDIMIGGKGNDRMHGAEGSDIYYWGAGSGNDTIVNAPQNSADNVNDIDKLIFESSITIDDLNWSRSEYDLVVTLVSSGETLHLRDYFREEKYKLNIVELSDGTTIDMAAIEEQVKTITGTEYNDTLEGYEQDDILWGLGGNDILAAGGGNDFLDGGSGVDRLYGGTGSDTYSWGIGSGNDTIFNAEEFAPDNSSDIDKLVFKAGISSEGIRWTRNHNDLVVTLISTDETLRINNYFSAEKYKLNAIELSDGTAFDLMDIEEQVKLITGTEENDYLLGYEQNDTLTGAGGDDWLKAGAGNDILNGGAGDDILYGQAGSDTYIWGAGFGNDTIINAIQNDPYRSSDIDKLVIKEGVVEDDLSWSRKGSNLIATLRTTGETLSINRFFDGNKYKIKFVEFSDGAVIDMATIEELAKTITGTEADDTLIGYEQNDTLMGLAGNDSLEGGEGDDHLDGGAGDDSLSGEAGSDIYYWGKGSGNDTIVNAPRYSSYSSSDVDKLVFKAGVIAEDLNWSRRGGDLKVTLGSTGETLSIYNYFSEEKYKIDLVELADGTVIDLAVIEEQVRTITGTNTNDTLIGYQQDDILLGLGGDDTLTAGAGNDALDGGAGNDSLEGGEGDDHLDGGAGDDSLSGEAGSDIYYWGKGSGNDTIVNAPRYSSYSSSDVDKLVFKAGVIAEDLNWSRRGGDLKVTLGSTGETLSIYNYFSEEKYKIDLVELADGTAIDLAVIEEQVRTITGTNTNDTLIGYQQGDTLLGLGGDDTLKAGAGNDVLDGGAGNDILYGEAGSDIYYWGKGSGNDTIVNAPRYGSYGAQDIDKLVFKTGVTSEDLGWSRRGSDLLATLNSSGETISIYNYFGEDRYKISAVELSDGTVLDLASIEAQIANSQNAMDSTAFNSNYELLIQSMSGFVDGGDALESSSSQDINKYLIKVEYI